MYKFSQKDAYMIFNKGHKINSRLARTLVQWLVLNYYEILNKALRYLELLQLANYQRLKHRRNQLGLVNFVYSVN